MAKLWKTSGKMSGTQRRWVREGALGAASGLSPADSDPSDPAPAVDVDELESDDLEVDDPVIDEAALPELDREDAEVPLRDAGYDDLLDTGWLDRKDDGEDDDERSLVDDVGLTIELDSPATEDDGAQIVDLDVGSLLTSLPSDGTELDLEVAVPERGEPAFGLGALRDVLLPEDDDESDAEHDDGEVGDDERFPVFDDDRERPPRPSSDDDADIGPDDLS